MKKVFIIDNEEFQENLDQLSISKKDLVLVFNDKNFFFLKSNNFNIINLFDKLEKEEKKCKEEFFKFLRNNIKFNKYLNFSRLSEFNFADQNIKMFYKLFLINKAVSNKNIKVIIYSQSIKKKYLEDLGFKNISFYNFKCSILNFLYIVKKNSSKFKILLENLLKEIFFNIFFQTKKKKIQKKIIYSHIKHHWKLKDNKLAYAYLKRINDYFFIISALRSNSHKLFYPSKEIFKKMNYAYNFEFIENYSSLRSILVSYVKSFYILFKIKVKKNKNFSNFFIDYLNYYFLIDCSKQLSFKSSFKNFFLENSIEKICIPTFELVEGRSIIFEGKKHKKIKILGYQHGFMGNLHMNRFLSHINLNKKDKNLSPHKIFIMGKIYKKFLNKEKIQSHIIGNPRLNSLPEKYTLNIKKNFKCLLLLDLHNWKNTIETFSRLKNQTNIYVKPHPYTYKIIKNYLKEKKLNIKLVISSKNLNKNYDFILTSDSGVIIEYALSGWPVFLIKNDNFMNYSPLQLNFNKLKILELKNKDIKKVMEFLNNKKKINHYIKLIKNQSSQHCKFTGETSEKIFQSYF